MRPLPLHRYEPMAGDVLAFSGSGPVAWLIHAATCSRYAHVGIVAEHAGRPVLFESTTLSPAKCIIQGERVDGPQAHLIHERIRTAGCRVWLSRPWWPLTEVESRLLTEWLLAQLGRPYDYRDAALSASRLLKRLKAGTSNSTMCSEMAVRAFQSIRRVPPGPEAGGPVDASDYSPRLAMWALCRRWQVLQWPRRVVA